MALLAAALLVAGCGGGGGGGTVGPPPPNPSFTWNYTALGDSLAVGLVANSGYVVRYQGFLQADNNAAVTLVNRGVNGWTSAQLRNALQTDTAMRNAVSNAQVVTWDIGGNDLREARDRFKAGTCGGADGQDCLRAAVTNFRNNWDAILSEILALRLRTTTILRTMDVYNPYVAEDKAAGHFTILQPYLDQVNQHIQVTAAAQGIPVARVFEAFNGASGDEDPRAKGLIAFDGLHADDDGHALIASRLRALGYAPLN
jgi:lysophospholipase L1-like esterase